jgi:hypothetical protein
VKRSEDGDFRIVLIPIQPGLSGPGHAGDTTSCVHFVYKFPFGLERAGNRVNRHLGLVAPRGLSVDLMAVQGTAWSGLDRIRKGGSGGTILGDEVVVQSH